MASRVAPAYPRAMKTRWAAARTNSRFRSTCSTRRNRLGMPKLNTDGIWMSTVSEVPPSELQRAEPPVQHRPVGLTRRVTDHVDQRAQPQHAAVVGRLGRLDMQLAVEGVALVH